MMPVDNNPPAQVEEWHEPSDGKRSYVPDLVAKHEYVRCEYDMSDGHRSFVEESSDLKRWLEAMKRDHSIKGFDSKPFCHSLGQKPIFNFLSQSEGGQVSIVHGLTEEQCETMKANLDPIKQHCGSAVNECGWTVSKGDIKWSNCFK